MPINTPAEIHQYVVCADIFVKKGDRYLALKRSAQKKYAPNVVAPVGGKVDLNENPYEAVVREVEEEAGVKVKNIKLKAVILELQPEKDEPYNWLVFHFSGEYESGEVIQTDEGELVWLTAEELKAAPLFPSVGQVIEHILDPQSGTVFATFSYKEHEASLEVQRIDACSR